MRLLERLFAELALPGKHVLDLGCGSGQVSVLAARMGALVRGVDIAPRMLEIARAGAQAAGVAERASFEEGDAASHAAAPADVVLLVGVVEYYADYAGLIRHAASLTRRTLVVAHTTRVAYRMLLRRLLFAARGANLYFHPMPDVIRAGEAAGLALARRLDQHAFAILVFERRG
jgi:2-polyprenyl-3-methyl-5-hydroxy-6-metoxy-1,4-benzoquinol methylase